MPGWLPRLAGVFNIGGGELIVILIIALIVLGPDKLPDAVRRAGRLYGELRRMSSGFQAELRDALDEPMREVRSTRDLVKNTFTGGGQDDAADGAPARAERLLTDDDAVASEPEVGFDAGADGDLHAVSGDRPAGLPPPTPARSMPDPVELLPPPVGAASALPPPGPVVT